MKYRPTSIREIGLVEYLNTTRDKHNGLGWDDFKQRMDLQVAKARIAEDFGMSQASIWDWVKLYKETIV